MIRTDVASVRPAARLRGELRLPGDKSISHRALLFATLAAGESRIVGAGDGADVRSTAGIMRALGGDVVLANREGALRATIALPRRLIKVTERAQSPQIARQYHEL